MPQFQAVLKVKHSCLASWHGYNWLLVMKTYLTLCLVSECKDEGIDTRIHGIKIKSSRERDAALNCDNFTSENLIRYPLIER